MPISYAPTDNAPDIRNGSLTNTVENDLQSRSSRFLHPLSAFEPQIRQCAYFHTDQSAGVFSVHNTLIGK